MFQGEKIKMEWDTDSVCDRALRIDHFVYANPKVRAYMARIRGTHPRYKFDREFLPPARPITYEKHPPHRADCSVLAADDFIEVFGGSWSNQYYRYFRVVGVDDAGIQLEEVDPRDLFKRLKKGKEDG